jgi:hypothetical protein
MYQLKTMWADVMTVHQIGWVEVLMLHWQYKTLGRSITATQITRLSRRSDRVSDVVCVLRDIRESIASRVRDFIPKRPDRL